MHEATVASNILDIVVRRIAQNPNTEALSIKVAVGAFRNVEEETLQFAFDALKLERPGCEHCTLVINKIGLVAKCAENQHEYAPRVETYYRCACGSGMGEIVRGKELDVVECELIPIKEESAVCTK
jgi:hydrogenase nickel insertion protein HypA